MANRTTGDYDAVLQLAPAGADRILASIHRKGHRSPDSADGPHFLHSAWFNLPLAGAPSTAELRGHLRVQVAPPRVSVADGSGSRVTVSVDIRTWFQRAPGSADAPEFLHGELAITTGVRVFECHGETIAEIGFGAADVQVRFTPAPGSGASGADVAQVQAIVPELLRQAIGPTQLGIGAIAAGDFAVDELDFKTLRRGSTHALALLLSLRDEGARVHDPGTVSEVFLAGGDDAAVALGREFFTDVLFDLAQGPLGEVRAQGSRFVGSRRLGLGFTLSFEARLDPASLVIRLEAGRVRLQVDGSGSLSPGGSFGFRLTQHFGLTASAGQLRLTVAGDSDLDVTRGNPLLRLILFLVRGRVTSALRAEAAVVVVAANNELNRVLDESVRGLLAEMALPGVGLDFTRASIDTQAIELGGRFDIGPSPAAVVSFTDRIERPGPTLEVPLGKELSAYESWIPGGTIERFRWTLVTSAGTTVDRIESEHRFVARVLPVLAPEASPLRDVSTTLGWPPTAWCLELHGRQASGTGTRAVVRSVCGMTVALASLDLRGDERLTVRVPDGHGGVLADVDPWGGLRPHAFAEDDEKRGYLLVHSLKEGDGESVAVLREVLEPRDARAPVVLPMLIVAGAPHGCPAPLRDAPELAWTHDPEETWRRRFGLASPGCTVLVGPGGREVWRDGGPLVAEELAKVLAALHEEKPRRPRRRKVRPGVELGAYAPDLFLPCGSPGEVIALRKLRGREIVLCFWTSWSDPSLTELERIAACSRPDASEGTIVLCINDGDELDVAQRTLKRRELDVKLVADPERAISRRYGVSCWPTTVRIDPGGRVEDVRLGLEVGGGEGGAA